MDLANGRRRSFMLAGVSALVALQAPSRTMAAANKGPAKPLGRVTIALAASQSLYQLPLTLAERLGYFRQAGLEAVWLPQESGAKALNLAVSAQADVVAGAFEHLFGLQQRGLNFQSFVQTSRTPQVCLGVSTRAGAAWQQVADLRGVRLGVSALDSTTHWMACQWLKAHGLGTEEVVFVEVGSSLGAVEALRSGAIDALCNPDPVMHWLELRNEVRLLAEARSLHSTRQLMGGAVPGACLWAHGDFFQRHPERAQALSDGLLQALKWLQTAGPTDILKTVPPSHWMGDRAAYLGAFEKLRESYSLDGLVRLPEVSHAWRAHVRLLSRPPVMRFALERTFTNVFAQKSRQRFLT